MVASFSFSALVYWRKRIGSAPPRCPCGDRAPGRCRGPWGRRGSGRGTPSRRASSRGPGSCSGISSARTLARIDLHQMQRRVLVARLVGAVGDQQPVLRGRDPGDRRQARGIELRRIEQQLRIALVALAPVVARLILRALAAREEVASAAHDRRRDRADLHQRAELLLELLPPRQVVEDRAGIAVLLVGPRADLGRHLAHALGVRVVALEPAIVVDDLDAVERFAHRFDAAGGRLGRRLGSDLTGAARGAASGARSRNASFIRTSTTLGFRQPPGRKRRGETLPQAGGGPETGGSWREPASAAGPPRPSGPWPPAATGAAG